MEMPDRIYVAPVCDNQGPAQRFGAHVSDEIQEFLRDESMVQSGFDDDANDAGPFPRIARLRLNLTALSRRYNLYLAAYQDKIYVFQPGCGSRILPSPSLILRPPQSAAGRLERGSMGRFSHQINHMVIGDLGNLEIVLVAYDDGDAVAYYTQAIACSIRARTVWSHDEGFDGSDCGGGDSVHKPFFHTNVGASAWGLAVHKKSRLIAVSSNLHEVRVFAPALAPLGGPCRRGRRGGASDQDQDEDEIDHDGDDEQRPRIWSNHFARKVEQHLLSRTRTWEIILPLGLGGHNIPSIAFSDDEDEYAETIVAQDIRRNTWVLDIWRLGSRPLFLEPVGRRADSPGRDMMGWGVLVLPESSFQPTATYRDALGLTGNQIIPFGQRSPSADKRQATMDVHLEIAISLLGIDDSAATMPSLLHLHPSQEAKWQASQVAQLTKARHWSREEEEDADGSMLRPVEEQRPPPSEARWRFLRSAFAAMARSPHAYALRPGVLAEDLQSEQAEGGLSIVPSTGEVYLGMQTGALPTLIDRREKRKEVLQAQRLKESKFSHVRPNLYVFRAGSTDLALQPLHGTSCSQEVGVVCGGALGMDNFGPGEYQNLPWDLQPRYSERCSMLHHVPEIGLVVVGSMVGKVALVALTKTSKLRSQAGRDPLRVRKGFRIDWILPRKSDEAKRPRPRAVLVGLAISPMPDAHAQGLDLEAPSRQGESGDRISACCLSGGPRRYRLILHYLDHSILQYYIQRRADEEVAVL